MELTKYLEDHTKTHLIFDFDETIYRLVLPWDKLLDALEKRLAPLDPGIFESFAKGDYSLSTVQNEYVRRYGDRAMKIIHREILAFEESGLTDAIPNPDLVTFVRENQSVYDMTIWSSNTSRVIGKVFKENDLEDVFTKIVSRLEVKFLKPNPEGFEKIKKMNISKEKYLMVGNSLADKQAAANAGIDYFHIDFFTKYPQED